MVSLLIDDVTAVGRRVRDTVSVQNCPWATETLMSGLLEVACEGLGGTGAAAAVQGNLLAQQGGDGDVAQGCQRGGQQLPCFQDLHQQPCAGTGPPPSGPLSPACWEREDLFQIRLNMPRLLARAPSRPRFARTDLATVTVLPMYRMIGPCGLNQFCRRAWQRLVEHRGSIRVPGPGAPETSEAEPWPICLRASDLELGRLPRPVGELRP